MVLVKNKGWGQGCLEGQAVSKTNYLLSSLQGMHATRCWVRELHHPVRYLLFRQLQQPTPDPADMTDADATSELESRK